MDSPSHGWIVNDLGHLGYLDNGQWSDWHQAFPGVHFTSVASVSPNDAWAVGDNGGTPTTEPAPVVLRFDGHAWAPVTIPALSQSGGAMLSQVTMVSATDGWMSGLLLAPLSSTQPQGETPILLHCDGSQWRPAVWPTNLAFSWISMSSATDGWALGWNPNPAKDVKSYLCHFRNDEWSIVSQFG